MFSSPGGALPRPAWLTVATVRDTAAGARTPSPRGGRSSDGEPIPGNTGPVPTIEELHQEWLGEWLPSIKTQVFELFHRREIHDGMEEMLRAQDHADAGYFWEAFHRMYLESQVLAIRRQADDDTRALSLRRLIGQLQHHRRSVTRAWYVDRWMDGVGLDPAGERDRGLVEVRRQMAHDAFDKFTDEPGGPLLSATLLDRDRQRLLDTSRTVSRYADTVVAHSDRTPPAELPTYADFEASIDVLGDLLRRYHLLIDQGGLVSATPTIQGDWKGPFRSRLA